MNELFSRRIVMRMYLIGTLLSVSMLLTTSLASALTTNYMYNAAGQLARVDYDINANITYDYDTNGNLVQRNVHTLEPGDVNNDGGVDLEDIILGLQVLAGKNATGISISGDLNADQRIGMEEILYGLGKIARGD